MSLGAKLSTNVNPLLYKKLVLIDAVIIPKWAKNAHHYIQKNYLALESVEVRKVINRWIDLIFGKDQQDHERFNMFMPLASEVLLK